jgi:hypothetical protein
MGAVDGAEDAACFFYEDLTSDGQRDAAGTIQELGAELFFEQRDLVGDGRLGQIAQACGPREVPQVSDRDEGPQLTEFHSRSLSDRFNRFIGRINTRLVHSLSRRRAR